MKTHLLFTTLFSLVILGDARVAAQNVVQNSNFLQGAAKWADGSCMVEADYYEDTYGGDDEQNRVCEIDKETCIQQRICIMPNTTYTLTFRASRRININTPPIVGIVITATGVTSGTQYFKTAHNANKRTYTNITWLWQNETLTMTIPAGTTDKQIDLKFDDDNGVVTYGVIIDDVQLNATPSFSLNGPDSAGCNTTTWTVTNGPSTGVKYYWAFTSGSPATLITTTPSATARWSADGTHAVIVTIDNGACSISFNKSIATEASVAKAAFTYTKDNLSIHFHGTDKNGVDKWLWKFGDRSPNSTEQNPVHEYLQKETFTVTLIVWNGCNSDSTVFDITIDGTNGEGTTGIRSAETNLSEFRIAPNPFSDQLAIHFKTKEQATVAISLFDMLGRKVYQLCDDRMLLPGTHDYVVEADRLPGQGFYHLTISAGKQVYTQKVVLIK